MEQLIRVGVVGIGSMGSAHAMSLYKKEIEGFDLVAVCDTDEKRLAWAKK